MSEKRRRLLIALAVALSVLSSIAVFSKGLLAVPAASAHNDWKKELEDICSQTQDAMSYSPEELKGLVGRCDALRPRIEQLDETQRKIYLKRLQMCRDLFAYTLESKVGK